MPQSPKPQTNPYLSLVEIPAGYLNLMGYVDESEVNGPGCRAVVWVQGCMGECPTLNPESRSFEINQLMSIDTLVKKILSNPRHEGVTFSGGEPFWQAPALAEVARRVKAAGLNVICFTGFTLERLQSDYAPAGAEDLLSQLDILIDGPYDESLAIEDPSTPIASTNQKIRIFNPALRDRTDWASDQVEIHIFRDGSGLVADHHGHMQVVEAPE